MDTVPAHRGGKPRRRTSKPEWLLPPALPGLGAAAAGLARVCLGHLGAGRSLSTCQCAACGQRSYGAMLTMIVPFEVHGDWGPATGEWLLLPPLARVCTSHRIRPAPDIAAALGPCRRWEEAYPDRPPGRPI